MVFGKIKKYNAHKNVDNQITDRLVVHLSLKKLSDLKIKRRKIVFAFLFFI